VTPIAIGTGLLWIVRPDESGLDASHSSMRFGGVVGLPGFLALVHRNREHGYDLRRIVEDGGPMCCEVMTNVF